MFHSKWKLVYLNGTSEKALMTAFKDETKHEDYITTLKLIEELRVLKEQNLL